MQNWAVRLIWMTIPLVLFGIIGMDDSFATVCYAPERIFYSAEKSFAVVIVTVASSERIFYDPPKVGWDWTVSSQIRSNVTINEVTYGNKDFPLKSDIVDTNHSDVLKIGDRYAMIYDNYWNNWRQTDDFHCSPIGPVSFAKHAVEYAAFFEDLLKNSCDVDKHYLIKNSDRKKICVSHDARDELIKMGHGFIVPNLSFGSWQGISENPPLDIDAYARSDRWYCGSNAVRSSTGDYCLPYLLNLSWVVKEGNNNLSISHLPNLGETATITVSNTYLKQVLPCKPGNVVAISSNLRFVDSPDSMLSVLLDNFIMLFFSSPSVDSSDSMLSVPCEPGLLNWNATVRAAGEGWSEILVYAGDDNDRIRFTVSNNTTDGIPMQNYRDERVFATLSSDKQHYASPDRISISGQFSDYVGNWIAYYSKRIPIDSENKFTLEIDGERFRKNHEQYLVLTDRYDVGFEQIKVTYDFQP